MMKKLKYGQTGIITFYAKKYKKFISRCYVWDEKCKITDRYVIFYDTSNRGYRCANKPLRMTFNERRVA
jgi:cytoplasmic iron level regulating protein YaaA (DUF328/UPF0246 family)